MDDILRPMLASLADPPLKDPQLVYEPKYDGIRAIAEVSPGAVRLWSRLGNEKTRQFPEIVTALETWARRHKEPVVLDGEIVALDAKGHPIGFQNLQGRIHLLDVEAPSRASRSAAARTSAATRGPSRLSSPSSPSRPEVAFIAFDILRKGSDDVRGRRLLERRAVLERVFGKTASPLLRVSEMVRGDGNALFKEAHDKQWEGLIAKHVDSLYKSGKRTPDWRKKKITHEQELVVGGWTEPRHTRSYFGALLLGVYERGTAKLVYAGHTGTGFDERELSRVMKLLTARETKECPFSVRPKTNERPHWVKPELVAQIRFTEWTADAK